MEPPSQSVIPNFPLLAGDLDNFTHLLTAEDARVMVDLLKLAVAKRVGERGKETMAAVLTTMAKTNKEVDVERGGAAGLLRVTWCSGQDSCSNGHVYVQFIL